MDVSDVIGHFGKFQLGVLGILIVRSISAAFVLLNYQLMAFELDYSCADENSTYSKSAPKCYRTFEESNMTMTCDRWNYESTSHSTIVQEWNLVCDQAWLISFGYFILKLGNFLVYVPSGQLADKFGRWPIVFYGQVIVTVTSFAIIFSNSIWMFLAIRFLLGIGYSTLQSPIMTILVESLGPGHRDILAVNFSGTFGLGMIFIAGLAYFITDWRYLLVAVFFPVQIILLALIWWKLPESTRWLLTTRQREKAKKQIVQHSKQNGKALLDIEGIMDQLLSKIEGEEKEKPNFLDLFTNQHLRKIVFILYPTFAFTVFINTGFLVAIGRLGGSLHLNVALSGCMESLTVLFYYIVVRYFDRRRGLLACFVMSGITFFLSLAVPLDIHWLKIFLAMFGRLSNTLAYTLLYVFACEIFPTNLRTVAVSGAMTFGRMGAMISPLTDLLARRYGNSVPIIMFGALSLATGVLFVFLPETKNKDLPDTIFQSEKLGQIKVEDINLRRVSQRRSQRD